MEGVTTKSKGTYSVRLVGADGSVTEGAFLLEDLGGSCKLTLRYKDKAITATSSDFWDALVQIRRRLEREQLFPACYGASRNVYPTDMSRGMARGLMAPRWEEGKKWFDNLVFIFHSGQDVDPVSVADQREFRQWWLAREESQRQVDDESIPELAA